MTLENVSEMTDWREMEVNHFLFNYYSVLSLKSQFLRDQVIRGITLGLQKFMDPYRGAMYLSLKLSTTDENLRVQKIPPMKLSSLQ
jgi:hypothetical protein